MSLKGQVAIVTGASQGIGQTTAIELAKEGADVLISYVGKDEPAIDTVAMIEACGVKAARINCDISVVKNIADMFDYCEKTLGKPDILVANAGVCLPPKPILEVTEEDYHYTFEVNAKGTFFCLIEAAKRLNDGGRIVAVSSSQVENPQPGCATYTGSKGAIEAFAKSLVSELAARNISINIVQPGLTLTPLALGDLPKEFLDYQKENIPFKRNGTPDDIAGIITLMCDKRSGWVSGQVITANGGSKL